MTLIFVRVYQLKNLLIFEDETNIKYILPFLSLLAQVYFSYNVLLIFLRILDINKEVNNHDVTKIK